MAMTERIITVITDKGTEVKTEDFDANEHLNSLELTPSKFVQEVVRKLKDNIEK